MKKYFFDTEFMEDGRTIELLSIGMVCEDGREYYAVSSDLKQQEPNDWVIDNVLPHLGDDKQAFKSRFQIAMDLVDFVSAGKDKPEFWGYYCVAPETRVLTADLQWVPAGKVAVGDGLLSFDETPLPGAGRSSRRRQWRLGTVESAERVVQPCYDLMFDNGVKVRCSADHRWLVASTDSGSEWRTTESLRAGPKFRSHVVTPVDVWEAERTWESGYLAAAFDGEGHLGQRDLTDTYGIASVRLGFAQRVNPMLQTVEAILASAGYTTAAHVFDDGIHEPVHRLTIGNREDVLRFLGSVRPKRLLPKFNPELLGAMNLRTTALVAKEFVGEQETVALRTDTKTYIAEGLASHNCDYDWVVLCQLYGRMLDLPTGWPMFAMDLKQLCESMGNPQLPAQISTEHNALADARWNRDIWHWLDLLQRPDRRWDHP